MNFKFINVALIGLILSVSSFVNVANASLITIRGYDDVRTLGDSRSIYGNQGTAESELFNSLNYSNWGITGVNRLAALNTVTAADLVGVDIFFTGLIHSTPPNASEVSALLDFVNNGGVLFGLGDRSTDLNHIDPLLNAFGIDLLPAPPAGALTILDTSHPIMQGPFGQVSSLTSGDSSAFTTLPGFDGQVLANNSNGTGAIAVAGPNGTTRSGAMLFFPNSEPFFSNMSGDNLTLFRNSMAYAVDVLEHQNVSVPEPSTLAIFALGMIGLASRRFKKQS